MAGYKSGLALISRLFRPNDVNRVCLRGDVAQSLAISQPCLFIDSGVRHLRPIAFSQQTIAFVADTSPLAGNVFWRGINARLADQVAFAVVAVGDVLHG